MLLAAAGKAQSQLLSPEPMLTGRQEVWKASLKLQEKFGKISCNYPNDSCTNHTTAPQIPCLQAEPKPTYGFKETCRGPQGGGERANRLQGLCFCWEGEGCSLKVLSSSVLFRADPSYGNSSSCLSLPSFLPLPTPPFSQPLPVPETLNRGSQDRVTAGGCYCPGLGNFLHSLNPNIFLAKIKPRIEPVILHFPLSQGAVCPPTAWAQSPLTGFPFSWSYSR